MSLGQDGRRWGETAGAVSLRERRWPAWVCEGPEAGGRHVRTLQGWDGKQSLATRAPSRGVPRGHKAQVHSPGLRARGSEATATTSQVLAVAGGLAAHKHAPTAHIFLGLLAIGVSSLEKCLFKPFANV